MKRVAILKSILIGLAVVLTAVLFLWPSEYGDKLSLNQPPVTAEQTAKPQVSDIESTTMLSPRFSGEDNQNQKWEIKAKKAHQLNLIGQEKVSLEGVEASLSTSKGEGVSFEAGMGSYTQEGKALTLEGGVVVKGYGLTLETEGLSSNLDNKSVHGEKPVTVKADVGKLSAQSFEIEEDGKIKLSGGVSGTFYPKTGQVENTEEDQEEEKK